MAFSLISAILWILLSNLYIIKYFDIIKTLNNIDKTFVILIFIIGGPSFAFVELLELFLDIIFPEGWDDENDIFR